MTTDTISSKMIDSLGAATNFHTTPSRNQEAMTKATARP
jgi:hypothetical protein